MHPLCMTLSSLLCLLLSLALSLGGPVAHAAPHPAHAHAHAHLSPRSSLLTIPQDVFGGAQAAIGDLGRYVGNYVQDAVYDPLRAVDAAYGHSSALALVEGLPESGVVYNDGGAGQAKADSANGNGDATKPLVQFQLNVPPRFLPSDSDDDGGSESFESTTIPLLTRSFANSYYHPSLLSWSPSLLPASFRDPAAWVALSLQQAGASAGVQFDRLGSLYLGNDAVGHGVEIWRTGNPQPIRTRGGTTWTLSRDVSRYYSLFARDGRMVFDFPNIVNEVYTAPINVSLSLTVRQRKAGAGASAGGSTTPTPQGNTSATPAPAPAPAPQEKCTEGRVPLHTNAPLVFPISKRNATGDSKWAVPGDDARAKLTIPRNARRAIVEVYASGTADDEFWYGHVNDFLVSQLPNGSSSLPAHGPYREVRLSIDGVPAGVTYPFPVIFTGGYLPFLWKPQASYGALDQPSYLFDVSAFLGLLCDGQTHEFALSVASAEAEEGAEGSGAIPDSWFVSANLQVELDALEGVTSGARPTVEVDNAATAWDRGGEVHGDPLTDGGWIASTVENSRDGAAPQRTLKLRGAIQAPSDAAPVLVETTHSIAYSSRQNLSHALNVADLTSSSLTTQESTHAGEPFLRTRGSFPHSSFVVNDTVGFYNVSLDVDYVYEQVFLRGLDEGGGVLTRFAQPAQLGIKAHIQGKASAFLDPKQQLAIVGGIGATNGSYTYTDSSLYTFSRRTNVFNRTITFDELAGNLAPYADPIL